jgi:hypothetical protein
MNRRIAHAAQIAALVLALALVPAALAAKGGGGGKPGGGTTTGSSSISAPVMVTDQGTLGLSHGDTITFNVSTTATDEPFVNLQCFKNGALVLNGSAGFFAWSMNAPYYDFTLNAGMWPSGAADCTAYLQMSTRRGWSRLASTSFHVDA